MNKYKNKKNIEFEIKRIYTKKIKYKSYNIPNIFYEKLNTKTNLKIKILKKKIINHMYEISLNINLKLINLNKKILKCTVHQSGFFYIKDKKNIKYYTNILCANILYPYASECISNLINRGSFSMIDIIPINFSLILKNKNNKFKKKNSK